jgi:hypothetical protein
MFSIDTARNKTKHKAADRGIVVVIIVDVVVDAVAVVVVVTCHWAHREAMWIASVRLTSVPGAQGLATTGVSSELAALVCWQPGCAWTVSGSESLSG